MRHRLKYVGWAVASIVAVLLVCEALRPHERTVDVSNLTWSRTISIERWTTVEKRTWRRYLIPSRGRITDTRYELYGWEEDEDGDECPVYEWRYYYEIEEWRYARDVTTCGTFETEPYWGDVVLSGPTGDYEVGKERESGRREQFRVTDTDGTVYTASRELWDSLRIGDRRILTVHFDKHLTDDRR